MVVFTALLVFLAAAALMLLFSLFFSELFPESHEAIFAVFSRLDRKMAARIGVNSRSSESFLSSFANYCALYPEQRFWQALRNWSGYAYIVGVKEEDREAYEKAGYPFEDTFNVK